MPEVEPAAANIVTVAPTEPYPTGTPSNAYPNLIRCHNKQDMIISTKRVNQSIANLAAHGLIAGGEMYAGA